MSVTSAMYTGVSGLQADSEAINVIGNNLANLSTAGFKGASTVFSDLLSQNIGNGSQVGTGTNVQTVQNKFTQGTLVATQSVTDLAISGNSFFAVTDPATAAAGAVKQNAALLTRAGSFTVNSSLQLVNPDGYLVLDTAGKPIQFVNSTLAPTTDFGSITSIDSSGLITYLATDGTTSNYYNTSNAAGVAATAANAATVQRLAVVNVTAPTALAKAGGNLYQVTAASGVPAAAFSLAANTANGTSNKINSDNLEQSNVDMASEFVNMLTIQRAYSANSKTITTADEMTQEVLGLIR